MVVQPLKSGYSRNVSQINSIVKLRPTSQKPLHKGAVGALKYFHGLTLIIRISSLDNYR